MRLLGGGSTLNQVVNDMNNNILAYNIEHRNKNALIVAQGTASGTAAVSSTVNIDINHGLSYIPQTLVWMADSAGTAYKLLPAVFGKTLGVGVTFDTLFEYQVDATKLRIIMSLGSASGYAGIRSFKYQFLSESVV